MGDARCATFAQGRIEHRNAPADARFAPVGACVPNDIGEAMTVKKTAVGSARGSPSLVDHRAQRAQDTLRDRTRAWPEQQTFLRVHQRERGKGPYSFELPLESAEQFDAVDTKTCASPRSATPSSGPADGRSVGSLAPALISRSQPPSRPPAGISRQRPRRASPLGPERRSRTAA